MNILDKLDMVTKTPSKRSSKEYFSMNIDELIEKFAYMTKQERNNILKTLDKETIDKINILQEGGILI